MCIFLEMNKILKNIIMMKLKSNVILTVIIVVSFLLIGGIATVNAQGFFSNSSDKQSTKDAISQREGALQRGFGDGEDPDDHIGDDGTGDGKSDEPGEDDPIGGGVLILSLLAGGYTLIKRNVRNISEDEA